jgi:hypothetical protein
MPKITPPIDRTPEQSRIALKKIVRMFYDLQRLRLQVSGRLYKRPAGAQIDLHEFDVALLERRAKELHHAEKEVLKDVQSHLKTISFYNDVLSDKSRYRGVGPTMAGVILSEYKIEKFDTASRIWSFTGLAPIPALRCRLCSAVVAAAPEGNGWSHKGKGDCTKQKELLNVADLFESGQTMRPVKGEKLPYNSFLKTKMVGVLGPVLLQCNSPWRKCYDDYKARKVTEKWGRSDAHRHQAAIRYMVKMLLLDIYINWRKHEKLPLRPSYFEEHCPGGHEFRPPYDSKPESEEKAAAGSEIEHVADIAAEIELLEEVG